MKKSELKQLIKEVRQDLIKEEDGIDINQLLSKIKKNLPKLEELIQKRLGFKPKLKVEISTNQMFQITGTQNLIDQLGNTLVKTLFTQINIEFWGGKYSKEHEVIWFNPQVSYTHPSGGSNGTDFIWDSLWFDINTNEWKEGRVIFK